MFSRKKLFIIVTIMALLGDRICGANRPGAKANAQPRPLRAATRSLTSNVAIVGHAVGFAETRPVRELMA